MAEQWLSNNGTIQYLDSGVWYSETAAGETHRMTTGGIWSFPLQSGCRVYRTTGVGNLYFSAGVWAIVDGFTKEFDNQTEWSTASNRFTPNSSGIYSVNALAFFKDTPVGNLLGISIDRAGALISLFNIPGATWGHSICVSNIFPVTTSQYIGMQAYTNSTVPFINPINPRANNLCIYRVG